MRWKFIDPTNSEEVRYRAEKLRSIDSWWNQFAAQVDELESLFSGQSNWDLAPWMQQHLGPIDPRLMWEFGPAVREPGRRLVITPESAHELRPLAATILDRAPPLPGWEFYAFRPAEPVDRAAALVKARSGTEISGIEFQARAAGGQKIDLVFAGSNWTDPHDETARSAAVVITETLLGEERMERWIGEIAVGRPPRRGLLSVFERHRQPGQFLTLDRLDPTVAALANSLVDQLPREPCYLVSLEGQWSNYELSPQPGSEFLDRDDMFVAISARPDVFEATCTQSLFYSSSFSRHGETFCYLKIDGGQSSADERFSTRVKLEDELNERLIPAKAGCVIGGGTGIRYSYIDLALADLRRATDLVGEVITAGAGTPRAWLLFFDVELSQEWVGFQPATPPPPMRK